MKVLMLYVFFACFFLAIAVAQIPKKWPHRKELLGYLLQPKDSIFIQNRKKLEALKGRKCNDSMLVFHTKTKSLEPLLIEIKFKRFEKGKHQLHLADTTYKMVNNKKTIDRVFIKNRIDGERSFGNDGEVPKKEIKSIRIVWNKKTLLIPKSAYKNLFELEHCSEFMPAEAYLSKTKKYLFVYLNGSIGGGIYAVKWVFDRKAYVTRIISSNDCTESFDFLDGTAKPCEKF